MLPYNSPLRNQAQAHTVSMLFNSLEHPPASYLGHEHQYRTADASHHVRVALLILNAVPHLPSCTRLGRGSRICKSIEEGSKLIGESPVDI